MDNNIIYTNESFELFINQNEVFIKVNNDNCSIPTFNEILTELPRIRITKFISLKEALTNPTKTLISIGEYKPIVEITTSPDKLKAYAIINLNPQEYKQFDKNELIKLIMAFANNKNIIFGLNLERINNHLKPLEKFCIADGVLPINGDDALINLYELQEVKPQIYNDGKVNHYEMNLINKVDKGDWVGERIEPTSGIPGKTVFGTPIPALPGKQLKLIYDKKTISANLSEDEKRTVLTSRKTGAVIYEDGILSVCNCLEISGDVSFETGNIDFDGFVEVKSGIDDNFSVRADNDIQIMGQLGLGAIDTIESRDGNIYIRGGIAGKNKAQIICNGDLYTKFASDCTIICNGTVNIGYYAMNANIKAKEVILESLNSKIIGGSIEADIRVVVGELGNRAEIPTSIKVNGFSKATYKEEYDEMNTTIDTIKDKINYISQSLSVYNTNSLDEKQQKALIDLEITYEKLLKQLKLFQQKRIKYVSYLKSKGDGEIRANKCVYPKVNITINNHSYKNNKLYKAPITYYLKDNELKHS
ncbi:hypothetical protein EDC18_11535 [Natranaerovirga pectinivora]|uniref:Flagellar Assembly Protein A N-terminal region domain-containing protein n=1 Tax=Natranaerovirga pectinivora TaxID=682400 RepID=A0A4R3MDH4_9FIRM|nr:FapA family protein [Natranaerovirga pectinivora]TCT11690.1 hypothetical protein EDC18_11535 [Natranaerovirga pectinivora]